MNLSALATSPAAFRDALNIDVERGSKLLGQRLDDWQRRDFEALDDALKTVARRGTIGGTPKLRAYLERPRGHSKTCDIAVSVAWLLFASKRKLSGVAAAADKEQAALIRSGVALLTALNPWLAEVLDVQTYKIVNKRTGSELTIISADAPSSYGLTPDFIVCDELTHWSEGAGEALWVSLFSAAAKKENCLLLIISNAGVGEGASWQWLIREAARTSDDWYFSRIEGAVAKWITAKQLAEQRKMLPAVAYARLWENKWTTGRGDALTEADIDRAILAGCPMNREAFGPSSFLAGLDLGIKRDASALTIVGAAHGDQRVRVAQVKSWQSENGQSIDLMAVEESILESWEQFKFELWYDPYQAALLAQRLQAAGVTCHEVPFTGANLQKMATALIESFTEGQITLYNDADLLADLRSLKVVEKSYGWRIDAARDKHGHADRAIALALALYGARQTDQLDRPQLLTATKEQIEAATKRLEADVVSGTRRMMQGQGASDKQIEREVNRVAALYRNAVDDDMKIERGWVRA